MSKNKSFIDAFRGRFSGIMQWHQLDSLWQTVQSTAHDGWYIYAVGKAAPTETGSANEIREFIQEIDVLLHREHKEDYCGIVYVDDPANPSFIKIFDPNNLGVVCGYSNNPPLPGWILSALPPLMLEDALPLPANRRRWWHRLIKKAS